MWHAFAFCIYYVQPDALKSFLIHKDLFIILSEHKSMSRMKAPQSIKGVIYAYSQHKQYFNICSIMHERKAVRNSLAMNVANQNIC